MTRHHDPAADSSDDADQPRSPPKHAPKQPPPRPSTAEPVHPLRRTYLILCAIRLLLVLVPQTGYIHPDEFFQSLEPMAGDEFGLEHTRTWEFNTTAPLRSVAIPFLTVRLPLNLLRALAGYVRHHLHVNPLCGYALLVWPRLCMAALSFVNDWALWRLCATHKQLPHVRMAALASSWVMLVFATRTFSNAVEMALASVLLAVVSECMQQANVLQVQTEYLWRLRDTAATTGDRVRIGRMLQLLPKDSLRHVATVASLCVIGCFNRPTFVVFGAPAVFFWLLRGMGRDGTTTFGQFNVRVAALQLCAVPVVVVLVLADSLYYGHLSLAEVQNGMVGMENFVVTPLNFLRYNLKPENTAEHGVHPWWLHAGVHVPLLFGVLGAVAAVSIARMTWRFMKADFARLPHSQSVLTLMIASICVPLIGLSCINHQEPRFLLPLTLPIIFTYAPELVHRPSIRYPFIDRRPAPAGSPAAKSPTLLTYWFTINIALAAFYGFCHQGGVVQLATHLGGDMQLRSRHEQTHLVTSHIYTVPQALLFLPSTRTLLTNRRTGQKYTRAPSLFMYEFGGQLNMDQLYRRMRVIAEQCGRAGGRREEGEMGAKADEKSTTTPPRTCRVLLALPLSLGEDLALAFWRSNSTRLLFEREHVFYPHVSTEAMPAAPWRIEHGEHGGRLGRHPVEMARPLFGKGALAAERKCTLNRESDAVWSGMWAERKADAGWASWAWRRFSGTVQQFGLALYRIELSG